MVKVCETCQESKSYDAYYRRPRYEQYPDTKAGYSTKCKICVNKDRRIYRAENLQKCNDADTNSRFKRTYGIDITQYNQIFLNQEGCCAGCKTHQYELKRKLVVDHNHETGVIRGLLCNNCNRGLGLLKDNSNVLLNLSNYITKSSELAAKSNVLVLKPTTKVG